MCVISIQWDLSKEDTTGVLPREVFCIQSVLYREVPLYCIVCVCVLCTVCIRVYTTCAGCVLNCLRVVLAEPTYVLCM